MKLYGVKSLGCYVFIDSNVYSTGSHLYPVDKERYVNLNVDESILNVKSLKELIEEEDRAKRLYCSMMEDVEDGHLVWSVDLADLAQAKADYEAARSAIREYFEGRN